MARHEEHTFFRAVLCAKTHGILFPFVIHVDATETNEGRGGRVGWMMVWMASIGATDPDDAQPTTTDLLSSSMCAAVGSTAASSCVGGPVSAPVSPSAG